MLNLIKLNQEIILKQIRLIQLGLDSIKINLALT
jgi:aryl carrier-like protein